MQHMVKKKATKRMKCPVCGEMGYLVYENRKKYRRRERYQRGKEFGTGKWVTTTYTTHRKRSPIFRVIHKDNSHCYLGVYMGKAWLKRFEDAYWNRHLESKINSLLHISPNDNN